MNTVSLGKIIRKLFPNVVVATAKSRLTKGKNVVLYRGIGWRSQNTDNPKLDFAQLAASLPDGAFATARPTEATLTFAIRTGHTCNGNELFKMINIVHQNTDDSYSWNLSIRGTPVNLEQHGISSMFEPTVSFLNSVVDTTMKLPACIGVPTSKDVHQNKKGFTEFVTSPGNENGISHSRSRNCQAVLGWLCVSDSKACWRCRAGLGRQPVQDADCINPKQPRIDVDEGNENVGEAVKEDDSVMLNEKDDAIMNSLLDDLLPGATEEMKILIRNQRQALQVKYPTQRRWSESVISLCLNMFIRSPKMYDDLKDSKALVLPSTRHLRRFKNYIKQEPGINREVFSWMYHAAIHAHLPSHGWAGGLLHDETKVQSDVVLSSRNNTPTLVGWVDTGAEGRDMRVLKEGGVKQKLANEAFQVVFLGYTGFRFPVYHCPTAGISASELSIIIHSIIKELADWGFQTDFILQDGGEENRQFIKAHFQGEYYYL